MVSEVGKDKLIGVLVVDDHPVVREGLCAVLNAEPDMRVLGEAGDGMRAEEEADRLKPDVILMDVYMPNRDGITAMVNIKNTQPAVKVLLLTVSDREDDLLNAIRFGADGYILKKTGVTDVIDAVRKVIQGQTTMSVHVVQKLFKDMLQKQDFALSDREKEVLKLIGEGLTNAQIAERLVIAYTTATSYVYRLIQKLHLKNRQEAMAYAIRHMRQTEPPY
jgi:DNA-binding NarL/FixJ family response regulator